MNALDRRRLLTSGAAAAVLAVSGMGVAASPSRGGQLRLGLSGGHPSDRWHGTQPYGLFMQVAGIGCAFETLTEIAPDGAVRGELATSWEPLDHGRSWVFSLRRDVVFHDGRLLTADDVVLSLRRHLKHAAPTAGSVALAGVERVRRLDAHTVRIDLLTPDADIPLRVADPQLIIHPARDWQDALTRGVGTGLYRLNRFEAGTGFTAARVEDHWKNGQAGWFEGIKAVSLPSATDRLTALVSGTVDAIDGVDADARHLLAGMGRFEIEESSAGFARVSRLSQGSKPGVILPLDNARATERWWFA